MEGSHWSLSPGVEPDPGAEGRQEPHPAGADAPGGGGAPLRGAGTCGHPRQRLHTNLPLQAAVFLLLVVGHVRAGRGGGLRHRGRYRGNRRRKAGGFALEEAGSSIFLRPEHTGPPGGACSHVSAALWLG